MKSFILHKDSLLILDELTDEQAGKLFKAISNYQNGIEVDLDFGLRMAFAPFKNQFVRDLERYNEKCERNKSNGNKGGRPKKDETEINPKNPVGYLETQANPKNPNEPYNKNNSNNNIYIENEIDIINKLLEDNKDIKEEMDNIPKPLIIDNEYYKLFINKWNEYIKKYTDRKTGILELTNYEKSQLKLINKPIKEMSEGMFILFSQDNKETLPQCWTRPTHFLKEEQFIKYFEDAQNWKITKKITQFHK